MQKQPNPFNQTFLRRLIPHRQITLTIPVSMAQACQNLEVAFADDILLGGSFWRLRRHYWGHINNNYLILHGPRAHRQFCFRTQGLLENHEDQTVLHLLIQLSRRDIYSLLFMVAFLLVALPVVLQGWGVQLMPFYLGFLYLMIQWHFQHYSTEISQFLTNIINDNPLESRPDS